MAPTANRTGIRYRLITSGRRPLLGLCSGVGVSPGEKYGVTPQARPGGGKDVLRRISCGCLCLLLFAIAFPALLGQRSVSSAAPYLNFQSSEAPVVRLGVRDKNGILGKYAAVWVVNDPDDKQYQTKRTVEHDDWGYVYFPDDFPAIDKVGRYSWKCLVNGQEVVHGSFECVRDGLQLTVFYP